MNHSRFIKELEKNSTSSRGLPFWIIPGSRLIELARVHRVDLFQAQLLALQNNILPERYLRNYSSITPAEQARLASACILMVGLGGLGGYVLEILGRAGVGNFILADGDSFEESNLNRQVLGTVDNLDKSKVHAARQRLSVINPFCRCRINKSFLSRNDLPELMKKADLVVDALGGIEFRPVLMEEAWNAELPLVTGFIAGYTGLASVVYPGGKNPAAFWQGNEQSGAEIRLGNMAPIVSLVASVQAAEAIRILAGKQSRLADRVFLADLETLTFELLEM